MVHAPNDVWMPIRNSHWENVSKSRDWNAHFTWLPVKNTIVSVNIEVVLHSRTDLGYSNGTTLLAGMENIRSRPIRIFSLLYMEAFHRIA